MNTHPPYNFNQQGNSYRFSTDKGGYYNVEFAEGSFYFIGFPPYLSVYEFSISVITLGDNLTPPFDNRVEATIVAIIQTFLSNHENSIIYVCETIDQRQRARHRKFDMWFRQNHKMIPELEKYDTFITYEDLEFLSSLIVHKNNPFKDELIKLFYAQANEYNKDE
jgi:Family of unknown function (DUF6169)